MRQEAPWPLEGGPQRLATTLRSRPARPSCEHLRSHLALGCRYCKTWAHALLLESPESQGPWAAFGAQACGRVSRSHHGATAHCFEQGADIDKSGQVDKVRRGLHMFRPMRLRGCTKTTRAWEVFRLSLSLSLSHARTHTHARARAHTHTHTHHTHTTPLCTGQGRVSLGDPEPVAYTASRPHQRPGDYIW